MDEATRDKLASWGYDVLRQIFMINHAYATADGWRIADHPKMSQLFAQALLSAARVDGLDPDVLFQKWVADEHVELPCLNCGELRSFTLSSAEATGVFNVFCKNGKCEDQYAFKT